MAKDGSNRGRPRNPNSKYRICGNCDTSQPEVNFYATNSKMFPDGRLNICKTCLNDMVNEKKMETVERILRQIDKPFIREVWETSVRSDKATFGTYIRLINSLHQYRNLTWEDSDKEMKDTSQKSTAQKQKKASQKQETQRQDRQEKRQEKEEEYSSSGFKVTKDLKLKWGSEYSKPQYEKLEEFWSDMMLSYQIETASHKDYLKKICRVSLAMDEALDATDIDAFKKLSDTYDKLMHSSKFQPNQRTAADKAGGLDTFGQWFERLEQDGFIPTWIIEDPDTVDLTEKNIKDFVRQLVLGDPNIPQIIEGALKRQASGEEDEEEYDDYDDEEYEEDEDYEDD